MVVASQSGQGIACEPPKLPATVLAYFDNMWEFQAKVKLLTLSEDGGRLVVVLDRTILYPQGGGQPADKGFISSLDGQVKFRVEDVRSKNGIVHHYGHFELGTSTEFEEGQEVAQSVDEPRRVLNSRLHSAGHLLDSCMHSVGLPELEPTKGHHFPDGPFVEYKGIIQSSDIESKRAALESCVNTLIGVGGKVRAMVVPYVEAERLCGGKMPDYIPKDSLPRIVCLGDCLGCPCGGTHVQDISEIGSIKVTSVRVKKGVTKVSYQVAR